MNAACHRRTLPAFLLVLAFWVPASADPITVIYDVQLAQRSLREGAGPSVVDPFFQQFTLSMTFESTAIPGAGVYGRPTFSDVPVPMPSPPEGLNYVPVGSTTHIALTTGGFFARAEAGIAGNGSIDGNFAVYSRIIQLTGLVLEMTPSPATPEAFPFHLAAGGFGPFNFSYSTCLGVGPFGPSADSCSDARGSATRIATYVGTATLQDVDPAPIPEPATLALVGSGLVLLGRYRKRRT